jgi:hypothetical protein
VTLLNQGKFLLFSSVVFPPKEILMNLINKQANAKDIPLLLSHRVYSESIFINNKKLNITKKNKIKRRTYEYIITILYINIYQIFYI